MTGRPVYFIQAESGPIKIGVAYNVVKRLQSLQVAHHERLALICTTGGGTPVEEMLHRRFAAGRIRGEWFRADTAGLPELIGALLRDDPPKWLTAAEPEEEEDLPTWCSCGWLVEPELAERGQGRCWTCQREEAA